MCDGQGQVDPVSQLSSAPALAGAIQTTCNGQSQSEPQVQPPSPSMCTRPLSGNSENRESENS